MTTRTLLLAFSTLSFALSLSNCTRRLSPTPGKTGSEQGSIGSSIYPHSSSFKVTAEHGTQFRKDATTCKTCHGEDLLGGNARVSCKQCHAAYPHNDEFKTSFIHGQTYFKNKNQCTTCHSTSSTQAGDNQISSCTKCHSYPHEPKWHSGEKHGKAYLAKKDTVSCDQCHKADSRLSKDSPEIFVDCKSCHIEMPHTKEFTEDHSVLAKESPTSCVACHKDYKANMPNYPETGCFTCHAEGSKLNFQWKTPE